MVYNLEDVLDAMELLERINRISLEDLRLLKTDGDPLEIPDYDIGMWEQVGLNNVEYIKMRLSEGDL